MRHTKRKAFLILPLLLGIFLLFSLPGWSTTYYVKNGGDDAKDGLSDANAWETIAKVNGSSFNAGDSVLFKRGSLWREQLTVPSSGSSGNPITFGAYGSGADPIINGADLITGWTTDSSTILDISANFASDTFTGRKNTRVVIPAALITADATSIRIQLRGHASADRNVDGCSIGPRSGTSEDFSETPIRITFDGGSNSTTVPMGSTKWSDWIDVTGLSAGKIDSSVDHLIHFYQITGGYSQFNPTNAKFYRHSTITTDETMVIDFATNENYAYIAFVQYIEGGATTIWKATCTTQPTVVWMDGVFGDKKTAKGNLVNEYDWYWASNVLYVYSATDPDSAYTSPGVEAGNRSYCIYASGKSYIITQDLTLKYSNGESALRFRCEVGPTGSNNEANGLTVTNVSQWGISIETGSTVVDGCTISHAARSETAGYTAGIRIGRTAVGLDPSGVEIKNNNISYVYSDTGQGIVFRASPNITISGNTIHHVYDDGIKMYDDVSGTVLIEHNEIYVWGLGDTTGMDGIGIFPDIGDSPTIIIQYNELYDGRGPAIAINSEQQDIAPDVYYNLCYRNNIYENTRGQLIIYENAGGGNYYNNVFYGGYGHGIQFLDSIGTTAIVKNNICQEHTGYELNVDSDSGVGMTLDYNCYYRTSGNAISYGADTYTIAQFSTYQAAKSQDANSMAQDPLFTNPANADFTLQSTSPCIDAGTDVGLTQDYEGNAVPQGAGVDIGGYEYPAVTFWTVVIKPILEQVWDSIISPILK